jgi:LPS-assembly lipoprotein
LAVLLTLAGCGLQPVYSGGGRGPVATALTDITVAPIPDRAGFLVRNALIQRLGESQETPHLRLEVELDDQIIGFGIRGDNSIARERRTLRARYRVVQIATGAVLLDATAGSDAGIDRVSSDYAVVAAETTALDRLTVEVARQISARIAEVARAGKLYPAAAPTP